MLQHMLYKLLDALDVEYNGTGRIHTESAIAGVEVNQVAALMLTPGSGAGWTSRGCTSGDMYAGGVGRILRIVLMTRDVDVDVMRMRRRGKSRKDLFCV